MALFVLQDGYRVVTTGSGGRVVHLRTGDALALTPSELQLLARATTGGLDPHERDIRPLVKKFAGLGVLVPVPPEPAVPAPEPAPEEPLADGPVPLFRGDLKVSRRAGGAVFEVSDPGGSRSFSLYDFELSVARMLDGRRTTDQVVTSAARLGIPCDRVSLQQFIRQLTRYGFLAPAGAVASPDGGGTWGPRRTWDEGLRSLYQSGLKMFRQGRYAEAVSYFEAMLEASAENPEATEMLAESRQRLKAVLAVTTGPLGKEPAAAPPLPAAAAKPAVPATQALPAAAARPAVPATPAVPASWTMSPPATGAPPAAPSPLTGAPPAAPFPPTAARPAAPAPATGTPGEVARPRPSSTTGNPFVDLASSRGGAAVQPGASAAAPTPWELPTELSALPPADDLVETPAAASVELDLALAPAAWTLPTEVAALPGPEELHEAGAAPPAWALPTRPGASSLAGSDLPAPTPWAVPTQPAASSSLAGELPADGAPTPWSLPAPAAPAWPAAVELPVDGVPPAAVLAEPAAAPVVAGEVTGAGELAAGEFFAAGGAAFPEGVPAAAAPLFPEQPRHRPARSVARTLLMFGLPAVGLLGAGAITGAVLLGWVRLPGEPAAPVAAAKDGAAPDGAAPVAAARDGAAPDEAAPVAAAKDAAAPDGAAPVAAAKDAAAPDGAAPVAAAKDGAAPAAAGEAIPAGPGAGGAAAAVAAAAGPGASAAAPGAAGWRSSTFVKRGRVKMATLRAARPGVVHWEAAPEQPVARKARLGALQTGKGAGLPLVTAKAGLFLPRLEEGANARPGAVLADVVYIEGFLQVTVPAPAPAATTGCEVVDEAGGRTAPCKIVQTVKKPGGFLVVVTAEPLWIDSGTVAVRFAAP